MNLTSNTAVSYPNGCKMFRAVALCQLLQGLPNRSIIYSAIILSLSLPLSFCHFDHSRSSWTFALQSTTLQFDVGHYNHYYDSSCHHLQPSTDTPQDKLRAGLLHTMNCWTENPLHQERILRVALGLCSTSCKIIRQYLIRQPYPKFNSLSCVVSSHNVTDLVASTRNSYNIPQLTLLGSKSSKTLWSLPCEPSLPRGFSNANWHFMRSRGAVCNVETVVVKLL